MRIVNDTPWRTDDLRRIAVRAAGHELTAAKMRTAVVVFRPRRPRATRQVGPEVAIGSHGHAVLGGTRATVYVDPVNADRVDLAFVVAHEAAHLRGATHADMRGLSRYRRLANTRTIYGWAADMPLRPRAVRPPRPAAAPRARPDPAVVAAARRAGRVADAATKVRAWERRLRLATTKVAIWRRRYGARLRAAAVDAAIGTRTGSTKVAIWRRRYGARLRAAAVDAAIGTRTGSDGAQRAAGAAGGPS